MRASRLLSILTTMQARGRVTARALAAEAEVSLRTIYRDMEALNAAGVPIYAERGSEGGYRLLDGYRTRLNGLSAREAETLFMAGLPGPAADLGLGAAMAAAQLKLLAALPAEIRSQAERMRARFHLDAPAWFAQAEQPGHLPLVANAVWEQRPLEIRYQSWKAEKRRRIDPLGLVLKSGAWYVVGRIDGGARTYRVSRILEVAALDERFDWPAGFDLAAYWAQNIRRLEEELHGGQATVRFSPWGVAMAEAFLSPFVRSGMRLDGEPDAGGWRVATMPIGSVRQAASELLRFGAEAEALAPPELRRKMAEIAVGLRRLYERAECGEDSRPAPLTPPAGAPPRGA